MKKIRMGVIGVGGMGKHHARNLFEIQGAELRAVSDIDESRADEIAKKYQCKSYTDYKEMLAKEHLDSVTIAVPTNLHYQVALDVIKRNTHLLIEKPITDKSSHAKKLIKEAKKRHLILSVGHIERFNPAVRELKKHLDEGEIGKVVSILSRRVGLYPPGNPASDVIIDLAIHDIDIFSYLLNCIPTKIWALADKTQKSKREDYAEILFAYKNSIHGMIQVNWITPIKIRQLSITGTKGYIELDYINQKLTIYQSQIVGSYDTFGEFLVKYGTPNRIEISTSGEEPLKRELKTFVNCLRNDKKPEVDGKVGLEALVTAEKIMRVLSKNK